jgi:signal transduction histidine kinase
VGIFTDLRERLQMEDQVEKARLQVVQSDKLASLGRMAAGLAHELNNPLTGIMVFAELLKESLPEEDPARDDLAGILEDVERCQEIVRGMLDYSRQSDIRQEDLDLNQVVEDSFNLIRDNAVFLHVDVQTRYHSQPLPIQGDAKLLRQVFVNLIMNAVDAMGGQGRLSVVTGLDAQGWRYAEVSDTGPGIPEENLNRVFDPFFTTKAVGRGTGLGLSVVYGVMQRHGGSISVKETGPEGTTFLVRLPAQAPAEFGLKGGALFDKEMSEHQEAVS